MTSKGAIRASKAGRPRFISNGLVAFFTASGLSLVLASSAYAKEPVTVSCDDTITADTTLDSDLIDCPNNGIVIGADDITLDLNGHRIDGDGTEFADCPKNEICDVGVANDGHDGVKVKGGSTREFAVGVLVSRARHNRVLEISSSKNVFFGAVVGRSSRSVIRDSSFSHNIPPEGDGIGLFGSDHNKIVDNSIKDNRGPGIHVDGSDGNLIEGNLFMHASPGVLIGGDESSDRGDRNEVRGNRFVRNSGGIVVARGSRNVIARNHLSRDGSGIGIEKGRHNVVARNVVVDPRATGIYLGLDFPDGSIGGVDNVIRRNVVKGSGGDAFLINKKGTSVLRRNVASRAKDDGFDVESRSTRLAKNRATHNADLGIQARRGVADGGGNVARNNGDRRQCTHIACR
jgi:parallel beta-helix repeat protein